MARTAAQRARKAAGTAARRSRRALRDPVRFYHVDILMVELEDDLERFPDPRKRPGVSVRVFEDMSDPALREMLPDSRAVLNPERAARGDICLVVFAAEEVAGWLFIAQASHRDPWSGLRVRLGEGEIYCYDLWMKPEHRRTGAAVYLARYVLRMFAARPEATRMYCWVDHDNRPSQKLCRGLGLGDCQRVSYARVLDRVGVPVPFSDRPRFGPFSQRGRQG